MRPSTLALLLAALPTPLVAQKPVRAPAPVLSQQRPPAPTQVTAKESEPGVVTVEWSAVPDAKDYYLWKEVRPNGARSLGLITETRYVDRDVKPGVTYSYAVAARSSALVRGWTAKSGDVVPGSGGSVVAAGPPSGAPIDSARPAMVNPQITTPVTATSKGAPVVLGPPPRGAERLASAAADTTPCLSAKASADTSAPRERLDPRSARVESRSTTSPAPTVDPTQSPGVAPGSATYREGKCRNGSATGYPELWDAVAAASGLPTADQVAAWKEIGVVALAYKHLLERQPTPEETRRDVAALKSGTTWQQLWRRIAQSPERDARFGYWAPAPIPSGTEAMRVFGLASAPQSQQCFGGLGPMCAGGIPDVVNGKVQPSWFGSFRMPDNTSMGYVEIGVAVGSILHDNACLRDMSGLNCNGLGAGDLIKVGGFPAVMEWNKASWNVIDQRTWRATFGPYPTDITWRDLEWYDDIRPTSNRLAMMAPVISMLAFPGLTEYYRGGETKRSRALKAPAGTSLDDTDVQFCASGAFREQGAAPFKASWGICK
jgi:hypothetical protein